MKTGTPSRAPGWLSALLAPGEISLRRYLILALLLRLPAVFFARGFEFLDHQYQYVDPAYMLGLGGSWFEPIDYVQADRSWVYPGFLAGVFWIIQWIGITEAGAMMAATRFVHALISLIPLAAFWTLVVKWKEMPGQRPLLLLVAANPLLVFCGVQPTGPTIAVGLSLAALFLFQGRHALWPLASGLLLGLAFSCRFQDALFGPVLFAAGLYRKRWRACLLLCLGAAVTLLNQGLVDLYTHGTFFKSPLRYLSVNLLEGEAFEYAQPFWYYFAIVAGLCLLVPPFILLPRKGAWFRGSGFRALGDGTRLFPVLMAAALFYLVVHSLIPRKTFRLVLPAFSLVLIVFAAGLLRREGIQSHLQMVLRKVHLRLFVVSMLGMLLVASFYYFNRGPVEAARALSRLPDFQERLLVVSGRENRIGRDTHVGGHFYLRRKNLKVFPMKYQELSDWLDAQQPPTPIYLMVTEKALPEGEVRSPWSAEEIGYFSDWPDLKRRHRRFIYRINRE